jgi:hypothetical protein
MKEDKIDELCSMHVRYWKWIKSLVRQPEGKRPLRSPAHRWEDNLKLSLRKYIGICGLDCLACARNEWMVHPYRVISNYHVWRSHPLITL